jgi:MFS family permease
MRAQAGLALGFLLAGFAPNLWVFAFALVVQGTCGGSMAASNAYLASQSQGAELSRSLDWTQFSARLALVTAPILLGWLASTGLAIELYRYLSVLPVLALAITWWLPTDTVTNKAPVASVAGGGAATAIDAPSWIGVLTVQFLFCFAMVVTFPYFIPYSERLGIGNDGLAGLLYSVPHLVYLVALPWLRSRSLAPQGRLLGGLALLALACSAQGLLTTADWLAPARVLYGIGMLLAFSGLNRAMSACANGRAAGRLFGVFDACGKWAGALGGVCAGVVADRFDVSMPFFVAAFAASLALVVAIVAIRSSIIQRKDYATTSAS